MARSVNHRGWIVVMSVASDDGSMCADFFECPDGGFGFEHFRAEPEDGGRWTAIGGHAAARYDSIAAAAIAGRDSVAWLTTNPGAAATWHEWHSTLP